MGVMEVEEEVRAVDLPAVSQMRQATEQEFDQILKVIGERLDRLKEGLGQPAVAEVVGVEVIVREPSAPRRYVRVAVAVDGPQSAPCRLRRRKSRSRSIS